MAIATVFAESTEELSPKRLILKLKALATHIPKSGDSDYDKSRPNFLLLAR